MRCPLLARGLCRLARDHSFGPCPARNGRRSEDCEIRVAARESIKADLAVSNDSKLTPQKTRRGTMTHMLYAGSLVFTPPRRPVDLKNFGEW